MAYFSVLSHFCGGTGENHKIPVRIAGFQAEMRSEYEAGALSP